MGDVQNLCAWVVLVKEGGRRLAWLSQLRHPYRQNPKSERITGSPQLHGTGAEITLLLVILSSLGQTMKWSDWLGSGARLSSTHLFIF